MCICVISLGSVVLFMMGFDCGYFMFIGFFMGFFSIIWINSRIMKLSSKVVMILLILRWVFKRVGLSMIKLLVRVFVSMIVGIKM